MHTTVEKEYESFLRLLMTKLTESERNDLTRIAFISPYKGIFPIHGGDSRANNITAQECTFNVGISLSYHGTEKAFSNFCYFFFSLDKEIEQKIDASTFSITNEFVLLNDGSMKKVKAISFGRASAGVSNLSLSHTLHIHNFSTWHHESRGGSSNYKMGAFRSLNFFEDDILFRPSHTSFPIDSVSPKENPFYNSFDFRDDEYILCGNHYIGKGKSYYNALFDSRIFPQLKML